MLPRVISERTPDLPAQRDAEPADRSPQLGAAYQRAMDSYELARRLVFDRYPGGLPERDRLTAEELELLIELETAESSLAALRRGQWV